MFNVLLKPNDRIMKHLFTFVGRMLIISIFLCYGGLAYAQDLKVSGKVIDAANSTPLIGVTVYVKGTTVGTVTDFDGLYSISVPKNSLLIFSSVGYKQQEYKIENAQVVNVSMTEETAQLDEVIVIGYGTQKKKDKTGAVANIKAAELNSGVLTDPIQGIQGKVSGVMISKKGGDPNGGFSVKIRGQAGIVSGSAPLYIIDGVPVNDITNLASEDILTFDVLKDASSTSIYGARGATGVVLITTKKGKSNQGMVEFNSYLSIDNVAKRLDFLSASEVRKFVADNGVDFVDGGDDVNWQDEVLRTGLSQSHNIAFSGGSESATYRTSLSHSNYLGVMYGSEKTRDLGSISLTQKALNNKLNVQANISGAVEKNKYVNYGGNGNSDILYQAYQHNPTDPIRNADGSFYELKRDFGYYNPVAIREYVQNERQAKRLRGNLNLSYEILPTLKANLNLGYTRDDEEFFYFEPSFTTYREGAGYGSRRFNNHETRLIETTFAYDNTLGGKHNVSAVAGYSFEENLYDGLSAEGHGASSDYIKSFNLASLVTVNSGGISSYYNAPRLISFFGRVAYNYDSKYYLTGAIRRDGSSKFGDNKKWGLFPSASIAWNIKSEDFLNDVTVIDQLKLRVGYGVTGNQNIDSFLSNPYFGPNGVTTNPDTGGTTILYGGATNPNPNLQWEENKEFNLGLDFGVINNRISGSIEYYRKVTDKILAKYAATQPPHIYDRTWGNGATIENNGLEVMLQAFIVDQKNISYKTNFTFSSYNQKIVSLSEGEFKYGSPKEGWLQGRGLVGDQNWSQLLIEGESLGTFYMPEYAGISSSGKFLFYTSTGGVTSDVEKAERRVVGHALPKFEIGWSNYFTIYKNWDLSFAFRAVYGNDVLNVTRLMFGNPSNLPVRNVLPEAIELYNKGVTQNPVVNSYYLEDGSFIRLENITVGYTFSTAKANFIKSARLYCTSNNLFILTNYKGTDPEQAYEGLSFGLDMYNTYPKTRTFTFGAQLSF